MRIQKQIDYVVAYKAKQIIDRIIFIGTKDFFLTFPKIIKEGVGFTITTKTYSIDNLSIEDATKKLLNNSELDIKEIINIIKGWNIPKTTFIELDDIEAFKVSNSWLNKSITYKPKGTNKIKGGWKPLCLSIEKEVIADIQDFYANHPMIIKN